MSTEALVIPALLAVAGFFGKSFYEIYLENRKRSRASLESKLQNFYWPICIRLKKNENVFFFLIMGKEHSDKESIHYKVAHYVEENIVLKNHEEILAIIINYRHLAEKDSEIEPLINAYIKHVSVYRALFESGSGEYPAHALNTPYPKRIEGYFFEKTRELQEKLNSMKI